MKMPGITTSPSPSIAKLLALSPFSRRSCGKTTREKNDYFYLVIIFTFDGRFEGFGNRDHHICTKDPENIVNEETA